ncbi:MAG: hypothetical protein BGP25_05165 [Lysobacterales bacterium 63-13]|nr:MAG: hypothetical protein BGP25_05165 [Xanthomonadales bacterium 63-13]
MSKRKLFSNPTQTQRDIGNLLADPDERQPDIFGSIEKVTLARIQLDPLNPRKLGLNPENPSAIDPADPDIERKNAELAELQQLAETIREHGLLQEPGVYRRGENYLLAWGERRVLACRLLQHETITVKILPERPRSVRAKQLIENMQRSGLSLRERLEGMRSLAEEARAEGKKDVDADYLQQMLGLKKTMAYQYTALLAAPTDVWDAIVDGHLTDVGTAATIAGVKDPRERASALSRLLDPNMEVVAAAPVAAVVSKPKSRGRPQSFVSLGKTTSGNVARHIAEKLLEPKEFAELRSANWDDLKVASDIIKQVIKKIEQRLTESKK